MYNYLANNWNKQDLQSYLYGLNFVFFNLKDTAW